MNKIKGYLPPPQKIEKKPVQQPPVQDKFDAGIFSAQNIIENIKKQVAEMVAEKFDELDSKLEEIQNLAPESSQKVDDKIKEFEDTAAQMIETIKNIPTVRGNDGISPDIEEITKKVIGNFPNESSLTKKILSQVPTIDEEKLMTKFKKFIPPQRAPDVQIIRERVELDPMSVIDQIMKMPKGKFKLKTEHIDGLDQTMQAFNSQLGRGYLHGGGDTVVAGTNVTITTNAAGKKVISSTGGGGSGFQIPTGTVDGSNRIFVFATAPNAIVVDGATLQKTEQGSLLTGNWTGTTTVTLLVAPTQSVFAVA